MKAYVIITLNLCAMHGANMYIYNKTEYLKQNGYRVYVYSAEQGEILIGGLKEYKGLQSPCLRFYPGIFSCDKVQRIISDICINIDAAHCEEIIVESTNIYSALWGEILAQKLKCKHLVFILQERFDFSEPEKEFLRFKLKRKELAGINEFSVGKMLEDENIPFDKSMQVSAYCNNTIDECKDEISKRLKPDAYLTIGSIGRLEKPYVLPLAEQLSFYCKSHSGSLFNIVFVGGTRNIKQIDRITHIFKECSNVNLVLTGAQFPIPRSFVDNCDLFISAAGSAYATYCCGCPTITLNPSTGGLIGIPGLTIQEGEYTIYTSNYPVSEIGSMIDYLMNNLDKIKHSDIFSDGTYKKQMEDEFYRQLSYVGHSSHKEYFDTCSIQFSEKSYRPFNILGRFVSEHLLYKVLVFARKFFK